VDLTTGKAINSNGPIRLGSPDPKTGLYVVSYTVQGNDGSLGGAPSPTYLLGGQVSGNIVAQFSGNTNYFANTSNSLAYTVSNPTYVITPATSTVTATASVPGVANLLVTDYSNFQGNVSLQCSGLPANAYCVFRPASAQLIPASGLLPNTQLQPLTINAVPVTLQIKIGQNPALIQGSSSVFWIFGLAFGFVLASRRRLMARKFSVIPLAAILSIAGLITLSGCGSNANPFATPPGMYAITITGTATPLVNGQEPACSYMNCTLPPDPVTNPSINVVKTVSLGLTVQ
jgi:hypothetical protein